MGIIFRARAGMNWLAHALLSENTPAFRVGNLLPDFLRAPELAQVTPLFEPGIRCHRLIDAFTDAHPVVRRSVQRFAPQYRRVAPVLVDVFYDHFLSREWGRHSRQLLPEFTREVYAGFAQFEACLPVSLRQPLERMRAEDWLGEYGDAAGLQRTLARMEKRLRGRVDLVGGLAEWERQHAALAADFREFFPELWRAVQASDVNLGNFASGRADL